MPNRNHACTLVELLICIVAVSIAAALAFPVLGRATQKGRLSGCAAQMKDLTAAMILYTADHDDRTLATGLVSRGNQWRTRWYHAINPYGVGTLSLVCPASSRKDAERVRVQTDYLLNDHFGLAEPWSVVASTETRIILSERADDVDMDSYMPWRGEHLVVVEPKRHGSRSNYAFADGHVRCLAFGHTVSPNDLHWKEAPDSLIAFDPMCGQDPAAPII